MHSMQAQVNRGDKAERGFANGRPKKVIVSSSTDQEQNTKIEFVTRNCRLHI